MIDKPKLEHPSRANVLGVGLSAINLDLAEAVVRQALEQKTRGYVCVTGVHGVSEAQRDPEFRAILNHAFLNTPDGMPMVWMGQLQGFRHMGRANALSRAASVIFSMAGRRELPKNFSVVWSSGCRA